MMLILKSVLSHVALATLVIVYSIFGGYLFSMLESKPSNDAREVVQAARNDKLNKLWQRSRDIRSDGDQVSWEYDTRLILKEFEHDIFTAISDGGWDGEDVGSSYTQWDMAAAVLYSVTLITTIGYGNITPVTSGGKLASIIYSVVGIPLFLVWMSKIGGLLASGFRLFFFFASKRVKKRDAQDSFQGIPTCISLQIIFGYLLLGALMFSLTEGWDYLTSAYFCFITLSTIGLGDYVPGSGASGHSKRNLVFTVVYVLFGLALLVMTFDLIKENVLLNVKRCAACLKIGGKSKGSGGSGGTGGSGKNGKGKSRS